MPTAVHILRPLPGRVREAGPAGNAMATYPSFQMNGGRFGRDLLLDCGGSSLYTGNAHKNAYAAHASSGETETVHERRRIAKISPPKVADIYPRKRLFQRLDKERDTPVTWIAAPAGSGKTTLLAGWLATLRMPALWYQVDKGDDDVATFFHYLGLAAKRTAPLKRRPLPHLTPEYLMGVPVFARRFFEDFYDRFNPPFAIVFDNYQEAPDASSLHEIMNIGLSLAPEGIRVFVLSRKEPPPAFARLRASGAFAALGWEDLRFSREEARGLISLRQKGAAAEKILDEMLRITAGWAAGLVLLAEGAGPGAAQASAGPSPERVFGYFASEVLEKLEPETRDFLILTSLLPKMTTRAAADLSGRENAAELLASLHGSLFFTEKLGIAGAVYQYHPLFRAFLFAKLKESLRPDGLARLQKKAVLLLEQAGQTEDAAQMCCEAGDWEQLVPLVLNHAHTLLAQGRWKTLAGWIEALPAPLREREPWLPYWLGACRSAVSPAAGKEFFSQAFDLFNARRDPAGSFLSLSGMIDSIALGLDTFTELDRCIEQMNALRREYPDYPSPEIEARVVTSMLNAIYVRQPRHPDVSFFTGRGLALAESLDAIDRRAYFYGLVGFILTFSGEFRKAAPVLESYRQALAASQAAPVAQVMFKDFEACYAWMSGDFETAWSAAEQGIAVSGSTGAHVFDVFLLGHAAAAAIGTGDLAAAGELIGRMKSRLAATPLAWAETFYHSLAGWKCLCEGDRSRADAHADLVVTLCGKAGFASTEYGGHLLKGLALHAMKKDCEASGHAAEASRLSREANARNAEFLCLLLEADIAFAMNKENRGVALLRSSLKLGREQGYVNAMYWHPQLVAELCVKALELGIEPEYAKELIAKRNLVPSVPPLASDDWPWAVRIYTLGRFEVLRQGRPLKFPKKAPRKPLELLKALIALGGQAVPEARLIDILRPDAEGDAGHKAFEITLLRLRELLDVHDAVLLQDGSVTLNPRLVWIDARAFDRMSAGAGLPTSTAASLKTFERALDLYQGAFLPEETGEWSVSMRERMRSRFLRLAAAAGRCFEEKKEFQAALPWYLQGIEVDELIEELYQRAMICYRELGRNAEALSVYNRCKTVFASYGIQPCAETEALRAQLMN